MEAIKVPFSGYADDCTLSGELPFDGDRLSDYLATTSELEVTGAVARALEDGRIVECGTAAMLRDELCVVLATGPRGLPERRVWTRQLPVRAQVGPYVVLGYLHSAPTIDPIKSNERRPVDPASIEPG